MVKRFGWIIHPLYLFSCLSAVSVLYLSVLGYGLTSVTSQSGALVSIVVLQFTSSVVINGGQQLLDESEKMFRKCYECPWYTWNQKNKKVLLLLMMNSFEPMTFSSYGIVSMENSLTVKMAKICWTLISVMKNMNDRNNLTLRK